MRVVSAACLLKGAASLTRMPSSDKLQVPSSLELIMMGTNDCQKHYHVLLLLSLSSLVTFHKPVEIAMP